MSRMLAASGSFRIPTIVLIGIIAALALGAANYDLAARGVLLAVVALGSFQLVRDTLAGLLKKHFALDFIAILAILVAVGASEFLVAAVIALMLSSGQALEEYGVAQAKKSLTGLIDRIPRNIVLWEDGRAGRHEAIGNVQIGQEVLVRRGEVIPLDGVLLSDAGLTDESSLTGEPYMIDKVKGDQIRSGTVNVGDAIVVKVIRLEEDSTYHKIVKMVEDAQEEKAPLVRLADRYSVWFTVVTLAISAFAYLISGDVNRVLAVLVVATPCPLILATPIALMGGVNAAARKRIIIKKLAAIEVLSRVRAIILDKTGTITIGQPRLTELELAAPQYSNRELLGVAEAIERNSLHPLAKAIVTAAKEQDAALVQASRVEEQIGAGISGVVNGRAYSLTKLNEGAGMAIEMKEADQRIAVFRFEDQLKPESAAIVQGLKGRGLELYIFTGDREAAARKVAAALGGDVTVKAECTPADKKAGIEELKRQGKTTAMVGDGINDAPALAYADVGLVFSNEEQTAASEAADIVFLGGEFSLVNDALVIAQRTIGIALQSIRWGIGISVAAMIAGAFGYIPPIVGAGLQEAIDVAVIINALRASRT